MTDLEKLPYYNSFINDKTLKILEIGAKGHAEEFNRIYNKILLNSSADLNLFEKLSKEDKNVLQSQLFNIGKQFINKNQNINYTVSDIYNIDDIINSLSIRNSLSMCPKYSLGINCDCNLSNIYLNYLQLNLCDLNTLNNIKEFYNTILIQNVFHYYEDENMIFSNNFLYKNTNVIEFINNLSYYCEENSKLIIRGQHPYSMHFDFDYKFLQKNFINWELDLKNSTNLKQVSKKNNYYYELYKK